MNVMNQTEGLFLLVGFGVVMILIVRLFTRQDESLAGFLAADRQVGVLAGSFSMAVSWMWAPAIFICTLQAYTNGLAGIFWFTVPNILCFFVFAPFAFKLRQEMPEGYTFPQFVYQRFGGNKFAHISMVIVFFGYQLGSIIMNSLAGGTLLHLVSGINVSIAIIGMTIIALLYSLLNGLRASIVTDVIQMSLVLLCIGILVPASLVSAGGFELVLEGLGGESGNYNSLLHPGIAFAMGIPMTCSLISGPFCDQQFYQRVFAIKKDQVFKTFVFAGLVFGIVPISLSLLGFLGAGMVRAGQLSVSDPQMVAPVVIAALLPKVAIYGFCVMAFAGLCSTMDSTYCALSALGGIDVYKTYSGEDVSDHNLVRVARRWMFMVAIIGTTIALLQPKLMWIFLVYGAMAPAVFFPAIFTMFSKKISGTTVGAAVIVSFLLGTPLAIYANVQELESLIVLSALIGLLISLLICVIGVMLPGHRSQKAMSTV